MIAANELRIGNLIYFSNGIEPRKAISVNARFFSALAGGRPLSELKHDEKISNYYSPIPLTPEILEKAGFVLRKDHYSIPIGGAYFKLFNADVFLFSPFEYNYQKEIKYVHELQNLYFALTGQELQISL